MRYSASSLIFVLLLSATATAEPTAITQGTPAPFSGVLFDHAEAATLVATAEAYMLCMDQAQEQIESNIPYCEEQQEARKWWEVPLWIGSGVVAGALIGAIAAVLAL